MIVLGQQTPLHDRQCPVAVTEQLEGRHPRIIGELSRSGLGTFRDRALQEDRTAARRGFARTAGGTASASRARHDPRGRQEPPWPQLDHADVEHLRARARATPAPGGAGDGRSAGRVSYHGAVTHGSPCPLEGLARVRNDRPAVTYVVQRSRQCGSKRSRGNSDTRAAGRYVDFKGSITMTLTTKRRGSQEAETARQTTQDAAESERQRAQSELLQRAMRMPGVAEVIDLHGRYGPYVPQLGAPRVNVRHSTGGNG